MPVGYLAAPPRAERLPTPSLHLHPKDRHPGIFRIAANQHPDSAPPDGMVIENQQPHVMPQPPLEDGPLGLATEQLNYVRRANPCPKVTDLICRLPLPALIYKTRAFKAWRPDADYGTDEPSGTLRAHYPPPLQAESPPHN